jgi:hypothetical protein
MSILSVRDGHCVAFFQHSSMPTSQFELQLATRRTEFSSAMKVSRRRALVRVPGLPLGAIRIVFDLAQIVEDLVGRVSVEYGGQSGIPS